MGSLTSQRQLEHVEEHVRDAVAKGATLLARRPARVPIWGRYSTSPRSSPASTPEHEAVRRGDLRAGGLGLSVRDRGRGGGRPMPRRYGLNASIWTRDTAARRRSSRKRIRAGSVNINEAYAATWGSVDAPFGGMKESGMGRGTAPREF